MRRFLPALLLLPVLAAAAPLDDAVALVLEAHPVLAAERAVLEAQTHQRDWNADVTLSWTQQGTEFGGAGGPNAGIRLRIPLFDRSHEIKAATARSAWQNSRDTVLRSFLAEVEKLTEQAAEVRATDAMRAFHKDLLEYRKKQVDEGLAEANTLWDVAANVQQAEHEYRKARTKLEAMLESVARQYGGEQWKTLQALLAEHVKPK